MCAVMKTKASNKLMFSLRSRTERQANPTLEDEINIEVEVDEF